MKYHVAEHQVQAALMVLTSARLDANNERPERVLKGNSSAIPVVSSQHSLPNPERQTSSIPVKDYEEWVSKEIAGQQRPGNDTFSKRLRIRRLRIGECCWKSNKDILHTVNEDEREDLQIGQVMLHSDDASGILSARELSYLQTITGAHYSRTSYPDCVLNLGLCCVEADQVQTYQVLPDLDYVLRLVKIYIYLNLMKSSNDFPLLLRCRRLSFLRRLREFWIVTGLQVMKNYTVYRKRSGGLHIIGVAGMSTSHGAVYGLEEVRTGRNGILAYSVVPVRRLFSLAPKRKPFLRLAVANEYGVDHDEKRGFGDRTENYADTNPEELEGW